MVTDTHGARGKYPELDGIRGLAILMVMAYHCVNFPASTIPDKIVDAIFQFGWVGVDLFFALSGFLITGILLDSRTKQGYLRVFFARRILRIFPLYYCFVLGVIVFSCWIAPTLADSQTLLRLQPWYWLYGVNVMVALHGFDAAPFDTGILWSLAIEEQFYLIWPFVVWKLARTALSKMCVALILCAITLRVVLLAHGTSAIAVYTLLPTRMDALLIGAFAALLLREPLASEALRTVMRVVASIGTGLVVSAVLLSRTTSPTPIPMQMWGFTGVGLIALSVILATRSMAPAAPLRKLLRSRVLMFFGAYSYCLYVVHYVVRNFVYGLLPPLDSWPTLAGVQFPAVLLRAALAVGASVLVALVSWHLIEKRFLALKDYFSYGSDMRLGARNIQTAVQKY